MPPSARSNAPARACDGAGERAAHVAEQLALEQRLGQRAAVDGDERARARAATRSWTARGDAAPCRCRSRPRRSTVASDGGDALEHREHLAHRQALADQLAEAARLAGRDLERLRPRAATRRKLRPTLSVAPAGTCTSLMREPS